MFKKIGAVGLAAVAGSSLIAGSASPIAPEGVEAAFDGCASQSAVDVLSTSPRIPIRTMDSVEGLFSFEQTGVSSPAEIKNAFNRSSKHLCGSTLTAIGGFQEASHHDWRIKVSGEVGHAFSATLDDLAQGKGKARVVLGCSCAGNRAGGRGTVNAEVSGVTLSSIIEQAAISEGVNTVVFVSSDGYEVALPLNYVTSRYSIIVYEVNGQDIADSIGGANQLWLGSTSAQYFSRNIVEVSFEARDAPPPAPGTAESRDSYSNVPGVGVSRVEVRL